MKSKKKKLTNAEQCARWRRLNPAKVKRDNARRRKRMDRRDRTLWHRRLRVLMLHCGEFCTRMRDRFYQGIEVRLTVVELAKVWFRDKAWTMHKPELDRIDPEGHYEFDNVRYIEAHENYARRRTEKDEPVPF